MNQIIVSPKMLGEVALKDFCRRCFWVKLHTANKLPYIIFPGIFNSIDGYTKKIAHAVIEAGVQPEWMKAMGDIVSFRKAPHWSKFNTVIQKHNILTRGMVDDILVTSDLKIIIVDYKTSKFTKNQDKLLPMYQVQLNAYALIHERCGMGKVESLFLVYFEPVTDEDAATRNHRSTGFDMGFTGHTLPVEINRPMLDEVMEKTRDIYERKLPPVRREGCKDCEKLDTIVDFFS